MRVEPLAIPDVLLIAPDVHRDERGFFCETYSRRRFAEHGIELEFVQDNHSLSRQRGTVRGLHFQTPPFAQAKLVRVLRGAIFDVAVDLRGRSATFGRHVALTLSAEDFTQVLVPAGFAHGFCTLTPDTEVAYKASSYYAPAHDKGLLWNDPALAIAWPVEEGAAVLSARDKALPRLADLGDCFGDAGGAG